MMQKKIVYSEIALSKRKAIKKNIKDRYGKERADKFSAHISQTIAKLKQFPDMGVSMREKYELDCDYYMLFIDHNYFTQTSHIKNGTRSLKNQYFNSQNSTQAAL